MTLPRACPVMTCSKDFSASPKGNTSVTVGLHGLALDQRGDLIEQRGVVFHRRGLDLDIAARRRLRHRRHRDVRDHAAGLEHRERFEAHVAADQVEHQIDVLDRRAEVGLGVVDHLVGAERTHELDVLAARGGGDRGAEMLGQLHRETADAAGAGVDQHALALGELARADDAGPGAQSRDRDRARIDLAQARRLVRQRRRRHHRILGERAPARRVGDAIDLVAGLEARHRAADLGDGAGAIAAQHMRQRPLRRPAIAARDLGVDRIDARGLHLHQNVVRPRAPASPPRQTRSEASPS